MEPISHGKSNLLAYDLFEQTVESAFTHEKITYFFARPEKAANVGARERWPYLASKKSLDDLRAMTTIVETTSMLKTCAEWNELFESKGVAL